jgi:hypothetical protein
MTTALKLINRAYTLLGIKDPGQAVDGTLEVDALDVLNTMIDSWRTEEFFVYQINEVVYALAANQQTVTVGPGQQIDIPVPLNIEDSVFVRNGNMDYPVPQGDRESYAAIIIKTVGSTYPDMVYYNRAYPFGTLYFWPVPATALELHLPVWSPLSSFADLNTEYELPPGYERALGYSLAEEVSPGIADVPGQVTRTASMARRNVKRVNRITPTLQMPIGVPVHSRFNIFSGQ